MFQAACGAGAAGAASGFAAPTFTGLAFAGLAAAAVTGAVFKEAVFTAVFAGAMLAGAAEAGARFMGSSFSVSRITGAAWDGAVIGSLRSGGRFALGMRAGAAVAVVQAGDGSGCPGAGRGGRRAVSNWSGLKLEYRIGGTTVHSPRGEALRAASAA